MRWTSQRKCKTWQVQNIFWLHRESFQTVFLLSEEKNSVGLMLVQRLRRWPNIKPTLGDLVCVGGWHIWGWVWLLIQPAVCVYVCEGGGGGGGMIPMIHTALHWSRSNQRVENVGLTLGWRDSRWPSDNISILLATCVISGIKHVINRS